MFAAALGHFLSLTEEVFSVGELTVFPQISN